LTLKNEVKKNDTGDETLQREI